MGIFSTYKRRSNKKLMMLVGAGVAVVLLLAGGGYVLLVNGHSTKQAGQAALTKQPKVTAETPPPANPTPQTYKSAKLNIELTHRKDWTLKESADGQVTVTSPRISYTGPSGAATTGVFTLKIRKNVPEAMQATIEKAVAPRNSEVIAYAAPAEAQRQYTNLSYAGQKDSFSFFIVTGNTELKAGSAFAGMLSLGGEFYLIAGGYGTDKSNSLAFDSAPKDSMDSTALEQAVHIVESLKVY